MKQTHIYIGAKWWCAGLLLLLALVPLRADAKITTPEEYAEQVQVCFANSQWEAGKQLLDESLEKYPAVSVLQYLMGKYWFQKQNYDQSRYHLIKALDDNRKNDDARKMLVDVEDLTRNYSSAICYVNELLEDNPYWRGLWRRKIELYRKQGNDIEADRLLKRINQIYPQDTVLHKDFVYSMELSYQRQKRTNDRKLAIATLQDLIKNVPNNEQYYLDLINLHLQEGESEEALAWTSRGLAAIPGSTMLVYKKVGILTEMGRHPEAMAFMRDRMRRLGTTPEMRRLYLTLVLDAARAEKERDPYVLYGIAYEGGDHSREVLDYLVNTALLRGYNDDALTYVRAMRRYYGDEKQVLYREYMVYRNMGEESRAFNTLSQLCARYPDDDELSDALCTLQLQRAGHLMEREQYVEALACAGFVTRVRADEETHRAAWERVYTCRAELKRYDEAIATLDTIARLYPSTANVVGKRADLLARSGRTTEALQLYLGAINHAEPEMRAFYIAGYTDIAIPYIKECLEAGATTLAFEEADQLYRLNPSNDLALRYAINAAGQLGRTEVFREYTDRGLARYPREPFYLAKKAASLDSQREYAAAIDLVLPVIHDYPGNRELSGALSQSSEYRALELTRLNRTDEALAVLDTALVYDAKNRSLLYTKGLAYEKKKQYDLAYYYQRNYEPPFAEQTAFMRHLRGLRYGMMRNELAFQYLRSRYAQSDAIRTVASLEYSRRNPKNTYTGRFNYTGHDGTGDDEISPTSTVIESGGVGVQLQAEWLHRFKRDWNTTMSLAWADRYFPKWMANIAVSKTFTHDWEVELRGGYRRLDTRNFYSAGPGVAKFWGPLWANLKADFFLLDSRFYYNTMGQVRYYPIDDGRSYIVAMAGIGSAPELSVLDRALPGTFSHANTMVGLGAQWLFTPNIALGLLGTWYTYYSDTSVGYDETLTRYRNLYNLYVQLYITF